MFFVCVFIATNHTLEFFTIAMLTGHMTLQICLVPNSFSTKVARNWFFTAMNSSHVLFQTAEIKEHHSALRANLCRSGQFGWSFRHLKDIIKHMNSNEMRGTFFVEKINTEWKYGCMLNVVHEGQQCANLLYTIHTYSLLKKATMIVSCVCSNAFQAKN